MSGFLLDTYPAGSTVYAHWHTFDSAGASVTLTGLATTGIEIYKNGSATQRASDAGYALLDTDGIDFDTTTGIHGISIDLADNTDAGFYAVGSQFTVVVNGLTVDGNSVSMVLGSFRVMAAEHTAGYPVVTIKDGTGTGELDTASGGVLVAAVADGAITAAAIAAGAIDADAIADNAIDAGAIAADAITSSKIADNAITANKIASSAITNAKFAVGAIDAAAIANGAIDAATFAADVDAEILSYIVDDATRIDASALNTLSGHDPGETIMGATDLGTGAGLTSLATAAALTTVDGNVDAIKAKTDNLPSDPADASVIAAAFDALPTAAENAAALLATALADVYAANGDAPTLQQAIMAIHQHLTMFGISGTGRTVYKLDGTTPAFVETLDDATSPTALSRVA
jgi:hypothetical protein